MRCIIKHLPLLFAGAIAGIAVALVCAVALSAYVVRRTLGAKRRREMGMDVSAKLDYSASEQLEQVRDKHCRGWSAVLEKLA
jgi:high-affinity Fe2+/Pb2+ permease